MNTFIIQNKAFDTFLRAKNTKSILILNPAIPEIDMRTTIYAEIPHDYVNAIRDKIFYMVEKVKTYTPGYDLEIPPIYENGRLVTMVTVKGQGDFLPAYAGNLDIINCAAIAAAECIAKSNLYVKL